jgi:glutamate N-acetyltransferase/amino-acid N-acetyltransferase
MSGRRQLGKILCAIGYSGPTRTLQNDVDFESEPGMLPVCRNGAGVEFSEEAKDILSQKEIRIIVRLNGGDFKATTWGCDLSTIM